MSKLANLFSVGIVCTIAAALLGGCTTSKSTQPPRSATEQLLLSTAADRAILAAGRLNLFADRKVFLDTSYFESYDSKYVIGGIRDALSRAGARLQDNITNSDIIIEARSGALSVDASDTFVGIPKLPVPIPLTGSVEVPEVAFYKSHTEQSVAKIALLAFARGSGEHIYSSGPLDGTAFNKSTLLFFVSRFHTDVPEQQRPDRTTEYQSWFPQYDPANMPPPTSTPKK